MSRESSITPAKPDRKLQNTMSPRADEFYKGKSVNKEGEGESIQLLSFIVDDEEYAVSLAEITEVVKMREITEVPYTPPYVAGIISLRGEIIPVINLQARLGLKRGGVTAETRILITYHTDMKIGLIVDRIMGVVRVHQEDIEITSAIQSGIEQGEFISGVIHHRDRLIILLNQPLLFEIERT